VIRIKQAYRNATAVKDCAALNRAVEFNERVNAFTTNRACTLSSDIKG